MLSVRIHWQSLVPGAFLLTPCFSPADPDLSNPTRPRLERPLDTIRSFEAAIYGSYNNNRASYARAGTLWQFLVKSQECGNMG